LEIFVLGQIVLERMKKHFFCTLLLLNLSYKRKIMKKFHFPVVVEIDEDGVYIVSCPMFKGCHAAGKTIDEALDDLREVIELCIEEESTENTNQFIGVREMEITIPIPA
jgi:predicted RNase H-like HicB family nuclease